jgi:hypothetical protein
LWGFYFAAALAADVLAAVVYVVAIPLAAVTRTYLYLHLRVEESLAPAEAVPAAVLPAEI